jgi:hypothetical protein
MQYAGESALLKPNSYLVIASAMFTDQGEANMLSIRKIN